jgi:hypothetical protein
LTQLILDNKIYSHIKIIMLKSEYIEYSFGLVIIILLIALIFSSNYNTSVEREYFKNYLELDSQIKNI